MSAIQTTTTTQTTTQKGNTLETTAAIKMPPFKVVTNGEKFNGRTREGKQMKKLLNQTDCDATLVLMEPASAGYFAVHTVWNANLVKSMANDINNHPLVQDSKVQVVVLEALQEMWRAVPTYIRYASLNADGAWVEFEWEAAKAGWDRSNSERLALRICENADQVELLRLNWIALQREQERKNTDQAEREAADAAFVMPQREEYALRKANQLMTTLTTKWEANPIIHTTRPYEIMQRCEEAMQMQACQIIVHNVGKYHVDKTVYLRWMDKKKYDMVTLDEVIAHLYQNWVTGHYTNEQPLAYQALKDLVNHIA
jgi:hypothetical protein